jgi:hypothetical protein
MKKEIQVGCDWWTSNMNKEDLTPEQVQSFTKNLVSILTKKYTEHWHGSNPEQGSAFRFVLFARHFALRGRKNRESQLAYLLFGDIFNSSITRSILFDSFCCDPVLRRALDLAGISPTRRFPSSAVVMFIGMLSSRYHFCLRSWVSTATRKVELPVFRHANLFCATDAHPRHAAPPKNPTIWATLPIS